MCLCLFGLDANWWMAKGDDGHQIGEDAEGKKWEWMFGWKFLTEKKAGSKTAKQAFLL